MPTPETAELTWDVHGQPLSTHFSDVYFSTDSGLEETRHVFIQHNDLVNHWRNLASGTTFTIGETGFGCGLNFLAAWQSWQEHAPIDSRLHFVSVEKYPLSRADLARALALWPELQPFSQQLQAQYPAQLHGFHRLPFGRVQLTLIYADAYAGFNQLLVLERPGPNLLNQSVGWSATGPQAKIDAWFLDGFAPAKNPDMWRPELLLCIAQLSRPGTRFATFTAASAVRKGLQQVGFEVHKVPGFGSKREMLTGIWQGPLPSQPQVNPPSPSWHICIGESATSKTTSGQAAAPQASLPKQAIVVGAGLAGCHSAWALAQRGIQVTVVDRGEIASGASGNAQGVLYAKLSHRPGILSEFNLSAYQFACRFYHTQKCFEHHGQACGALHLAQTPEREEQYYAITQQMITAPELAAWLNADQASEIAGVKLDFGALHLPQAGWLAPRAVCAALLNHPHITTQWQTPIDRLEPTNPGWQLWSEAQQQIWRADVVVLACAHQTVSFEQCQDLPVRAIRGQVTHASATSDSQKLRSVLCGDGYIAPASQGRHCLGATFDLHCDITSTRDQDHIRNLEKIARLSPGIGPLQVATPEDGRVGFRCATLDYLPIVGPVPQSEVMKERFRAFRRNAKSTVDQAGAFWPGLYVHLGHGSRGLTYAPLAADTLACMITGEPLPLPREQLLHLHPARFLIRHLMRNRG